jgi:hypothetical protein
MRLGAREARHEVLVFGVVSRPSLDIIASIGAAVKKRRHAFALFFFLAVQEERRDRPAKGLPCARTGR